MKLANQPRFNIKANITGFSTTILSLAMLAGMSACQGEQSSPAASAALPQVQTQALEMTPSEKNDSSPRGRSSRVGNAN